MPTVTEFNLPVTSARKGVAGMRLESGEGRARHRGRADWRGTALRARERDPRDSEEDRTGGRYLSSFLLLLARSFLWQTAK